MRAPSLVCAAAGAMLFSAGPLSAQSTQGVLLGQGYRRAQRPRHQDSSRVGVSRLERRDPRVVFGCIGPIRALFVFVAFPRHICSHGDRG